MCAGGHINWFAATYQGIVKWSDHEWPDDDYNFWLLPFSRAGGTASEPGIRLEFKASETIDHFKDGWWDAFHYDVDNNPTAAVELALNKPAVVTGLAGLDCEHDCGMELHPVYALAINVKQDAREDEWAIFVRNWGNEGWCGEHQHIWNQSDLLVRLPWKPGAVSVNAKPRFLHSKFGTDFSYSISWAVNEGVQIHFHLPLVWGPDNDQWPRYHGELYLDWTMADTGQSLRDQVARASRFNLDLAQSKFGDNHKEEGSFERRLGSLSLVTAQNNSLKPPQPPRTAVIDDAQAAPVKIQQVGHLEPLPPLSAEIRPVIDLKGNELRRGYIQFMCGAHRGNPPGFVNLCSVR
jgi:hypothetical protein